MHMHAGATRNVLYACAYVREIIHSLKLVDYLPVYTHKPYNNYHRNLSTHVRFSMFPIFEMPCYKKVILWFVHMYGEIMLSGNTITFLFSASCL